MADILRCSSCGMEPKYPVGPGTIAYTCATCAMGLAHICDEKAKNRLAALSPEDVKSCRKAHKPKLTQKDFDTLLKLPTNHTNRVENGHILPHENLFMYVVHGEKPKRGKKGWGRKN